MLGNGVKQTTATTGTGDITLSAVAGMPKFSDVFGLNIPFSYTLLDSNGLFIESGIGYLTDATTLVRARVSATFISGVYNAANPSAASLAGTTTIIGTPHAATLESMAPNTDKVSAGLSRLIPSAARNSSTTTSGPSALRVYYVPFLLRMAAPVASLAINVTAVGAATTVARAGVYACNESGYPGALLATTGDLDTATTGIKTGTLSSPLMLPPGWYFTAVVCSGTPTIVAYTSSGPNVIGQQPFGLLANLSSVDFRTETVASAVLPTTASTNTSASAVGAQHAPLVYLGLQ